MMDKQTALRPRAVAFAIALACGLSACGGGGGGANVRPSTPPPPVDPGSGGSGDPDFIYDSSSNATWSKDLGGPGALIKDGTGTLILTGENTYTGGTTIRKGTLQVGAGGEAGSFVGDVVDNGTLIFNRSYGSTFNGAVNGDISGSGVLVQNGTDTLTLNGTNTYTGGTVINSGRLRVGSDGTSGSIIGDVTNNGSLLFSRSDDLSFGGVISGSGSLVQFGDGKLTITAVNTYTGITSIQAGTLELAPGATLGAGNIEVDYNNPYYSDHYILQVDSGVPLLNHVLLGQGGLKNQVQRLT